MPTIFVHKLASCFCSKNLVSLFLAWVVPSVNVRQATAQVGLSPVKFAVENNFCTAGRTSHECPTFNAASGVDSTRCANTRRVPRGAGVGRRYREARRSVALNRCCRDLSNPRRGQKNAVPLLPFIHHYRDRFVLPTRSTTTQSTIHYLRPLPLPLLTTMTTKNQEHRGKSIGTPPKNWTVYENTITCSKNLNGLWKPISVFKKASKFQWKNTHSTILQNAWNQKDQHFHWKTNLTTKKQWFSVKNDPGRQKN